MAEVTPRTANNILFQRSKSITAASQRGAFPATLGTGDSAAAEWGASPPPRNVTYNSYCLKACSNWQRRISSSKLTMTAQDQCASDDAPNHVILYKTPRCCDNVYINFNYSVGLWQIPENGWYFRLQIGDKKKIYKWDHFPPPLSPSLPLIDLADHRSHTPNV